MKYLVILLLILNSNSLKSEHLAFALESAGANRGELERLLSHYSKQPNDSLKYKAAVYLIENMPYHYSYVITKPIEDYFDQIEREMARVKNQSWKVKDSVYRHILDSHDDLEMEIIEDTKIMTAQYLINNIEHSFSVWDNQKWARHLSFEEFCELILPYKVFEGQILDDWKEFFYKRYNKALDNFEYSSIHSRSSYLACGAINQVLHREMKPYIKSQVSQPILRLRTLLSIPWGTCDEYSFIAEAAMRANGIPVGIDFTPQWPFRSLGHSWNFIHDNQKTNIPFEGAGKTIGVHHKKDHIMAKVYRNTYKINRELEKLNKIEDFVPPLFSVPFVEDVTLEHLSAVDIQRNVNTKNKYVYLAVFNNRTWDILAWGENQNGKAFFKNVGKDVVYLPVIYTRLGVQPIGIPFVVTLDGKVKDLIPDALGQQVLKLDRKYPLLNNRAYQTNRRKIGSKIQASNNKDFSDLVTFHRFDNLEKEVIINPDKKKYRYWRVLSKPGGYSAIAELSFFDEDNKQLLGEIIGTEGSFKNQNGVTKEAAFDGKLLTYFDAPKPSGGWVGMDFKDSVSINRVVCVMRGDGNDIEIGDEYELRYWSDGQWISLGNKLADDMYIVYDNCPKNALFLLSNRTKGKEERIFTYENGKQVWW